MKTTLAVGLLGAAAVALAPAAHAGTAGYLTRLSVDYGLDILDESQALNLGRSVCMELKQGTPREVVATSLFWHVSDMTRAQADGIAYAAQQELCPETQE
ncbi:hypothetical protein FGG44_gp43 [Mycobacterium phage MacnCheese]|uniref:DUF732 domain-containing protein n=1 Tax=Mycobacterium phage MacnCheese TaxID=2927982 RepID=I6W805_9CAUD|nr:hypothetical protein FGG44_gp43 [Mycobacterium phage MacnCheese]AFN37790.1 hypothetical protein MACNCHEESE_43 [Mycobacterium phage MacnCheese]